jgi:hypothetical protein
VNDEKALKEQKLIIREKNNCLFLIMNNKVNVFNLNFIRSIHEKLNEIE